jgi:hypothetical protein
MMMNQSLSSLGDIKPNVLKDVDKFLAKVLAKFAKRGVLISHSQIHSFEHTL